MKRNALGLLTSGVMLVAAASIVTAAPADAATTSCARGKSSCTAGVSYTASDLKRVQIVTHQSSCGSGSYCPVAKGEFDSPNGAVICRFDVPADGKDHSVICKLGGSGTYRVFVNNLSRAITITTVITY